MFSRRTRRQLRYVFFLGILGLLFLTWKGVLNPPPHKLPKDLSLELDHKHGENGQDSIDYGGRKHIMDEYRIANRFQRDGLSNPKESPNYDPIDPVDPNRPFRSWERAAKPAYDPNRKGPGEGGLAYHLPKGAEVEQKRKNLFGSNGFNALASDHVAMNRSIRDLRYSKCKDKEYRSKLPTASVIIPFHNEHWSTLLRSVYSIVDRSPKELLHEVILADDFSNKDFLKGELDRYIKEHWPNGLVKVVRTERREGLIRARLIGARAATGDVIIFLDSHSECGTNWLPPLLDPIQENEKTAVCPFVDVIDFETLELRAQDEGARGAFDWELYYKRLPLLPEDLKDRTKPFKSPVMAGGYFAMSRKYFWELGGYDEGLDIWGGEQYELSFKIWQCGGQMVDAPCSRIGHIYRKYSPFPNPGVGDFLGRNYKRVAEVWMDEYKEYIYKRRSHYRNLDPGDLSKPKALREKLNCKPFKWFMEEIAFDLVKKYPPVEPEDGASGELRNEAAGLCIDTKFKKQNERFELEPCMSENPGQGGQQNMVYSWHKDLRPMKGSVCFDVSAHIDHAPVVLYSCHEQGGNQLWKYKVYSNQLYHPSSDMCMDCDAGRREIFMRKCDGASRTQKWKFKNSKPDVLKRWQ